MRFTGEEHRKHASFDVAAAAPGAFDNIGAFDELVPFGPALSAPPGGRSDDHGKTAFLLAAEPCAPAAAAGVGHVRRGGRSDGSLRRLFEQLILFNDPRGFTGGSGN